MLLDIPNTKLKATREDTDHVIFILFSTIISLSRDTHAKKSLKPNISWLATIVQFAFIINSFCYKTRDTTTGTRFQPLWSVLFRQITNSCKNKTTSAKQVCKLCRVYGMFYLTVDRKYPSQQNQSCHIQNFPTNILYRQYRHYSAPLDEAPKNPHNCTYSTEAGQHTVL